MHQVSVASLDHSKTVTTPILEAIGLSKHYGGIHALSDADLHINPGEVVGIMGDNGAGKSTLVKILSGAQPATAGQIRISGAPQTFKTPTDARSAGIETVYQDLSLAEHLDVLSNLFLGREEVLFKFGGLSILNRRKMAIRAKELLGEIGVNVPGVNDVVGGLSGGQRQGVAIARAAGWGSQLIIMDEPTAALGLQETQHVHDIILGLKARGVAVLLVSHNMQQVLQLTDRVYVFRRGKIVCNLETANSSADEIISYITGAKG
ncbi:MAG: putative transporter ATP-binding protein [Devosia sp.]|uniref:ATP-binding cassette domain-containing protein n=1 Tax=Devosia sp. TaxID=1871048 RepID=UPI002629F9A9|nr:ATP-binding cassette domain-containing protein [Devosia sp.]MDB5527124.1 putative transporter ATP-binding protein [Devosia sp.]